MSEKSGKLIAREVAIGALGKDARDAMWGVFARYYAGISRATFDRDLASKQRVITLLDSGDKSLQGFSTLEVYDRTIEGRRVIAVFSGDTIVDEAYWGQKALQTAFFRFILRTKLAHLATPLYWFLISKGYKTYLLLSRNFVEYWPRHDQPTPSWQSTLIAALASDKFGDVWDPETGILRMQGQDGKLRQGIAPVDSAALSHADIRFFVNKNRGYKEGDELACIGLIDLAFAASYAKKRLSRVLGIGKRVAPSAGTAAHEEERTWASETAPS